MKKLFYSILAISALAMASCTSDEDGPTYTGGNTGVYTDDHHVDIWIEATGSVMTNKSLYVLPIFDPSTYTDNDEVNIYGKGASMSGFFAGAAITDGLYYYAATSSQDGIGKFQVNDNETVTLVAQAPFQTNQFSTGSMVEGCFSATHAWLDSTTLLLAQYNGEKLLWVKYNTSGTSMKFMAEGEVDLHTLFDYSVTASSTSVDMSLLKGENFNESYPQTTVPDADNSYSTTVLETSDDDFMQEIYSFSTSGHMRYRESDNTLIFVTGIKFKGAQSYNGSVTTSTNRGPLGIVAFNTDMTVKYASYCNETAGLSLESYGDTCQQRAFVDEESGDIYFLALHKDSGAYSAMGSVSSRSVFVRVKSGSYVYDSTYGTSGAFDPSISGSSNSVVACLSYASSNLALMYMIDYSSGGDGVGTYVKYDFGTNEVSALQYDGVDITDSTPMMYSFHNQLSRSTSGEKIYFYAYPEYDYASMVATTTAATQVYSYDTATGVISEVVKVKASFSVEGVRAMDNY